MLKNFQKNKRAYSLLELSIVIMIVSILMSGGLSAAISSAHHKKLKITEDRINIISKAMTAFLATNKRLPCPASPIVAKQISSDYGTEGTAAGDCTTSGGYSSTSNTNIIYGMVPIRALGLESEMAEDGFESKFGYLVDNNFTDSTSFGTASATGNIIIQNKTGSATLQTITSDAIFVLISYGSNKSGAYDHNVNASVLTSQNTRSTDLGERENDIDGSSPTSFDNIIISKSLDSDIFDDLVLSKTRDEIVSDSKDMSLIKCPAYTSSTTYNGTFMVWADGNYNQIAVSTTDCPVGYTAKVSKPTRRCGAFGVWEDVIHACIVNP